MPQMPLAWAAAFEPLDSGRIIKTRISRDGAPVTFGGVLTLWQEHHAFRTFFMNLLSGCAFSAYRWETPAISSSLIHRPFEFVLLNSPELAPHPDRQAFAEHFRTAADDVVAFTNLGGDATLIVPRPIAHDSAYPHVAAFHRGAPESQRHSLWQLVGATLQQQISQKPIWLSTAGAGVSWLHVRLDQRPKYYGYAPYRSADLDQTLDDWR